MTESIYADLNAEQAAAVAHGTGQIPGAEIDLAEMEGHDEIAKLLDQFPDPRVPSGLAD